MFSGRLIHADTRIFDWIAAKPLPPHQTPDRLRAGCKEEEAAYFYLRKRGYVMVARASKSTSSGTGTYSALSRSRPVLPAI